MTSETRKALRIVHVEDSSADALLLAHSFKGTGLDIKWTRVEREADYRAALECSPHAVIADYSLPQFSGLHALQILKESKPEVPFILVSGTIGEERAAEAVRLGANDYLLKDRLARLPTALEKAVNEAEERAAHKRSKAEVEAALRRAQAMAKLAHVITGPDGAFESWSETLPQLAGLEIDHLPRSTSAWLEIVHSEDRASFRAQAIQAAATRQRTEVEYRLQKGDGRLGRFRQTMEPLDTKPDVEGAVRWFNTIQDVTESSEAAQRIRTLNRVYALLSGINAAIARTRDRDELFREACRIAVEMGGFRMAWLGTCDPDTKTFIPIACAGHEDGFLALVGRHMNSQTRESVLVMRAARAKVVVAINDIERDAAFPLREAALARGYRAGAALPLMVGDKIVGAFGVFASEPGVFDVAERRLLQELAGDISFAVEHIEKAKRLDYLAYYDALTGLPNRSLFLEHVAQACAAGRDTSHRVAVMVLDIDRFKNSNDTLGRNGGDALLRKVGERIAKSTLAKACIARLGADRFAMLLPDVGSSEDLGRSIEERLRECFDPPFEFEGMDLKLSAKIGIALSPEDGSDGDTLCRNAESALKRAKRAGEAYLFYSKDMTSRVAEHLRLESRLRRALEREEFVLYYQPKVELESRRIVGLEALIRWRSDGELVPPIRFIPLMEETGLILEVGAWAMRRAAQDHRSLVDLGLAVPRIAVNVSAVQLGKRDFVDTVKAAIELGTSPPGIDVEITESRIMEGITQNIDKLVALRDIGIQLAIDDFGTGYSSLAYLAQLPVQALKIDRSFIVRILHDPNAMTLVSTIISLGHSLNLKVVAEGVDADEQAKVLRLLRCDQMQGYLFSKPAPLDEVAILLRAEEKGGSANGWR